MMLRFNSLFNYVFGAEGASERGHLRPRWLWLRALGLIFFSAFYSLLFQIRGLIGPDGILPAGRYLSALHEQAGARAYWYVPSLLWLSSGNHALMAISWVGLIASVMLVLNFWPRGVIAVCLVMFLSFVTAAQEFSSYQSDGMLLEAAFISLFFAPVPDKPPREVRCVVAVLVHRSEGQACRGPVVEAQVPRSLRAHSRAPARWVCGGG
jgi:hypothetical protein